MKGNKAKPSKALKGLENRDRVSKGPFFTIGLCNVYTTERAWLEAKKQPHSLPNFHHDVAFFWHLLIQKKTFLEG